MIDYKPNDGMFCAICKKYGKPPPSTRGAWVSSNWVKATELLRQHAQALASGGIVVKKRILYPYQNIG